MKCPDGFEEPTQFVEAEKNSFVKNVIHRQQWSYCLEFVGDSQNAGKYLHFRLLFEVRRLKVDFESVVEEYLFDCIDKRFGMITMMFRCSVEPENVIMYLNFLW